MVNYDIEMKGAVCLVRAFLAHCEACKYSDELMELLNCINSFLYYYTNVSRSMSKSQLLWLQVKLYEAGVCLLHYEDFHPIEGCHRVADTLDFALAFFEEALELAYVVKGTSQDMSTLAPLSQIGLVLKQKGHLHDSKLILIRALDLSCQLEISNDTADKIPNFAACKSGILQSLGDIQHKMGNFSQAKELYDHAFEYCKLDEVDEEGFENMINLLKRIGGLAQRIEGVNSKNAAEYFELAQFLKNANELNG